MLCAVLSHFSHVQLSVTPWTVARQAPLSMAFSRQESWSVLPLPTPGDLPDPGIKPTSLASPALTDGFFTSWEELGSYLSQTETPRQPITGLKLQTGKV